MVYSKLRSWPPETGAICQHRHSPTRSVAETPISWRMNSYPQESRRQLLGLAAPGSPVHSHPESTREFHEAITHQGSECNALEEQNPTNPPISGRSCTQIHSNWTRGPTRRWQGIDQSARYLGRDEPLHWERYRGVREGKILAMHKKKALPKRVWGWAPEALARGQSVTGSVSFLAQSQFILDPIGKRAKELVQLRAGC